MERCECHRFHNENVRLLMSKGGYRGKNIRHLNNKYNSRFSAHPTDGFNTQDTFMQMVSQMTSNKKATLKYMNMYAIIHTEISRTNHDFII